jgi:hypothetical protein
MVCLRWNRGKAFTQRRQIGNQPVQTGNRKHAGLALNKVDQFHDHPFPKVGIFRGHGPRLVSLRQAPDDPEVLFELVQLVRRC